MYWKSVEMTLFSQNKLYKNNEENIKFVKNTENKNKLRKFSGKLK